MDVDIEERIDCELQKFACYYHKFADNGDEKRAKKVNVEVWTYLLEALGDKVEAVRHYHHYMGYKKEIGTAKGEGNGKSSI